MKGLLDRLKGSLPGRLATAYGQSKAGNHAAGLAFNGFMTMLPLMLGLLAILALIVRPAREVASGEHAGQRVSLGPERARVAG